MGQAIAGDEPLNLPSLQLLGQKDFQSAGNGKQTPAGSQRQLEMAARLTKTPETPYYSRGWRVYEGFLHFIGFR